MKKNLLLGTAMLILTIGCISEGWSSDKRITALEACVYGTNSGEHGVPQPSRLSLQGQLITLGQNVATVSHGLQYQLDSQGNVHGLMMMKAQLMSPGCAEIYFCRMSGLTKYNAPLSDAASNSARLTSFKALCVGLGLSDTDTTAKIFAGYVRGLSLPVRKNLSRQDAIGSFVECPDKMPIYNKNGKKFLYDDVEYDDRTSYAFRGLDGQGITLAQLPGNPVQTFSGKEGAGAIKLG